jgi:thymidylate synthase
MHHDHIEQEMNENNIPTRAISLMWNQRSVDTFLGLPFNIASYGLLLEIIAKAVNMIPDELIGNLGDVHLYSNHIEQAKEQIGRELTLKERIELWEQLPNRDVMDFPIGPLTDEQYHGVLSSLDIPTRTREPYPLPTLKIRENIPEHGHEDIDPIPWYSTTDFTLKNYQSHPAIKAPLSN